MIAKYSKGHPGSWYRRNGDPGDPPEPDEPAPTALRVVIARYARRRDYHHVLKRRLVALGRFLAARVPGARWRPAVDTAPVLERELAWQAGLGWIGRNTCLINRRLGSEVLLVELHHRRRARAR